MKNNRKAVEERQSRILTLVGEKGEITVEELAQILQVSPMTVRRDLQILDRSEELKRLHGRAVTLERAELLRTQDKDVQQCRDSISAYAAGFVQDGDTLFINGSRTALNLLRYLGDRKVRVCTNNGWALAEDYPPNVTVQLIGGELYRKIMIGEYVVQNILQMTADRTFIGCAAVYDDGEFRYDIPTEIGINEIMISRTKGELYILADHTKLVRREAQANKYGSFRYNYKVTLLTDSMADPDMIRQLRENDINVIQVPAGVL